MASPTVNGTRRVQYEVRTERDLAYHQLADIYPQVISTWAAHEAAARRILAERYHPETFKEMLAHEQYLEEVAAEKRRSRKRAA